MINAHRLRKASPLSVPYLLVLVLVIFLLLEATARGHSALTEPKPYGRECRGCAACPPFIQWYDKPQKGRWSKWHDEPTVWRRGQMVDIRWEKNNHNGGFVRLSLVPEAQMFNRSALARLTFYVTCWGKGAYACRPDECGSDMTGRAFQRRIVVPPVVPDGSYVLTYLWFGGVEFRREDGRFPDYTSCARVKVSGGVTLESNVPYTPLFDPGPEDNDLDDDDDDSDDEGDDNTGSDSADHKGLCLTSARSPAECTHGCKNVKAGYGLPLMFSPQGLKYLQKLRWSDFVRHKDVNVSQPRVEEHYARDPGVCAGDVCCSSSCSGCSQHGCEYRTGGNRLCCPDRIRRSGRNCNVFGAPCRLSTNN